MTSNIIKDGFLAQIKGENNRFQILLTEECPTCGMKMMKKGDWMFCPAQTTEIPDSDCEYHCAHNFKTGRGFTTI